MRTRKGFSLVELCVVLAIVAILLALVGVNYGPMKDRGDVRGAVNTVRSAMTEARSQAIAGSTHCKVEVVGDQGIRLSWVTKFIDVPGDAFTPANPPPGMVWDTQDNVYKEHESSLYKIRGNARINSSLPAFQLNEAGDLEENTTVQIEVRGEGDTKPVILKVTPTGRLKG